MLRTFLFIAFPLFLFSCNNNDNDIASKLEGTWQDSYEDHKNDEITFTFGHYTYKTHYPDYYDKSGRFYVKDDSIFLMQEYVRESKFAVWKITNLSNDSLTIDMYGTTVNYIKIKK
jgi:hypothetical protein